MYSSDRLDIGCGENPREGFLGVDSHARSAGVAPWEMWSLNLQDGCVEEVWSSHAMEHVARDKVLPSLREWHRVLKEDGLLTLRVPNFDYIARYWQDGASLDWAEQMVYGLQTHEGEFHRSAFWPRKVEELVRQAGFRDVEVHLIWFHNQETIEARARK